MSECDKPIEKYKCKSCHNNNYYYQTNFLASLRRHIKDGHSHQCSQEDIYKCLKCHFVTNSYYLKGRHSLFGTSKCADARNEDEKQRFLTHYKFELSELNFAVKYEPAASFRDEIEDANRSKSEESSTIRKARSHRKCESTSERINWFICKQCPYKSNRKSSLKVHILCRHTHHKSIKWFTCKECNYKSIHSNLNHIQLFDCEQCPSKYKQRTSLTRHVKLCHAKPEDIQWYQCSHCSYKSKQNTHLKRHIKSHHEKPEDIQWFNCGDCNSKFKTKHQLQSHIRECHLKPEDIRWYKCPHCSYKSKRNGRLRKHIKPQHCKPEDIQWFECKHCSSKFKSKDDCLKSHVRPNPQ